MSVLFISADAATWFPVERTLRAAGIPFTRALLTGSGLATPTQVLGWSNTTNLRNYLRQFQAVIIYDRPDTLNAGDRASHNTWEWLNWNNPEDPPIAYFNVCIHSNLAGAKLPSDFPLVRPNPADLDNTAFRLQPNTASASHERHLGWRVKLEREGEELYICAANSRTTANIFYAYRLDPDKHTALGVNGEVLARPVSEDITAPPHAVLAYRYHKHLIMPMLMVESQSGFFWLLYALKCLSVQPLRTLVGFLCMDDALTVHNAAGQPGQPTRAQFAHIAYETYRYLATELYPRTGCAMVCGLFTGGRYNRQPEPTTTTLQTHWQLVREGKYYTNPTTLANLEPEAHAKIIDWHHLLLRHHHDGLPCTIHDHTIRHRQNRLWSSFTRHNDEGFPYAAPNNVPKGLPQTVVRREQYAGAPPEGTQERIVDGNVYYELGLPMSGADAVVSDVDMRSIHGARIAWESAVAEMRALGFPDAHGGEHYRLVISPNFLTGGPAVWRTLKEIGYQLVRARIGIGNETLAPAEHDVNPSVRIFEGLHTVGSLDWDPGATTGGTFGLYHPTQSFNATTVIGLDLATDITGVWNTDTVQAGKRAYRRYVGMATERWLRGVCTLDNLNIAHPPSMLSWADPADPLRPIDWNDPNLRINFLLEIAWNLEKVVRVLNGYLRFGTVREYVQLREVVFDW